MSQSDAAPPAAGGRKWFDLHTTRGWIETAGALVVVLGGMMGLYFQAFPRDEPKPQQQPLIFTIHVSGAGHRERPLGQ